MPLTATQRATLIKRCNQIPFPDLLKFVLLGDITLSELPGLSPERKAKIEETINSQPNPNEQRDWQRVLNATGGDEEIYIVLQSYVQEWESKNPPQNHVAEAKNRMKQIEESVRRKSEELERQDWENLDSLSRSALEEYLRKYPHTTHRREILEMIWSLVNKNYAPAIEEYLLEYSDTTMRREAEAALWDLVDKENVVAVNEFIAKYPQSSMIAEARAILDSIVEWDKVKSSGDIFTVAGYLAHNPNSPFRKQAELLQLQLRREEIEDMKRNKKSYDIFRLNKLINEEVIRVDELYRENLITPEIFDRLNVRDFEASLPDIQAALENANPSCPDGYTDVFFFGIPGTGKTCVLMGLTCSDQLIINLASYGGDYAEALQAYTEIGKCPPANPGDYVSTIHATVNAKDSDAVHKLNLVEMSGEEFAFEIARHEKESEDGKRTKVFNFEQMGGNATNLLKQGNRKVFFLIIDPTVEYITFRRRLLTGYDENTGEPQYELVPCSVRQKAVIQRMVNLFENPENAEIMKRVDSIHVIVTKADLLGDTVDERNAKAKAIIDEKYQGVLAPLKNLAKEFNFNVKTGYRPKLYTFSLGSFYLGGMYEYNNYDSNRLVKAIRNATAMARAKTWWDKFCEKVN